MMAEGHAPTVLVIGGSDPLAFSGIEADQRHLEATGASAICVKTAATEQTVDDLLSVKGVEKETFIADLAKAIAQHENDISAVKIGMLHSAPIVWAVVNALKALQKAPPVVVDPVLATSSGGELLDSAGIEVLKQELLPLTTLLTPNIPELEQLSGFGSVDEGGRALAQAVRPLLDLGAEAILVKGGHARDESDTVVDFLVRKDSTDSSSHHSPRIPDMGAEVRGTGCALASCIAAELGRGLDLNSAVKTARIRIHEGIADACFRHSRFLVLRAAK